MATDFNGLRTTWNRLGEIDPLWAVLSDDAKKGGRWDVDEFFESGRVEVDDVLGRIDAAMVATGLHAGAHHRALDFGCGVGRISQALSRHVDEVDGVDIAASMVERARTLKPPANIHFHLSTGELLEQFDDGYFDLVYTAHVLQHMEPVYQREYVGEFFRVLRPGGIAMLEVVTEPVRGASEALPDEAFHADITVVSAPPRLAPSATAPVVVRARNSSPHRWPSVGTDGWYVVTLGGHWWPVDRTTGERRSTESLPEPRRAKFPDDVGPGEETELTLLATAPEAPGDYRLAVDLVQEGVGWFASRGGTPVDTAVIEVRAPGSWQRASAKARRAFSRRPEQADEPVMEMHGTNDATLREWVTAAGGRVLTSFDWDDVSKSRSQDWQRRGYVCLYPEPGS